MIAEQSIVLAEQEFILTNFRAVFWPAQNCILLADLHLGKTSHFQKAGIAVPKQVAVNDLQRLQTIISHFNAEKVIVVGDFFHASKNEELTLFADWKLNLPTVQFQLVKGNHDRLSQQIYQKIQIEILPDQAIISTIEFVHQPEHRTGQKFSISGHIHPGVRIRGKGKQTIKLPCYLINQQQLILPAFSSFTGLDTALSASKEFSVVAITKQELFRIQTQYIY